MRHKVSRRFFLGSFFILVQPVHSKGLEKMSQLFPGHRTPNFDSMAKELGISGAAKLGQKYLQACSQEVAKYEADQLAIYLQLIVRNGSSKEAITTISEKIKCDFSEGNSTIVDGWVLSRTECQLCTLIALSALEV